MIIPLSNELIFYFSSIGDRNFVGYQSYHLSRRGHAGHLAWSIVIVRIISQLFVCPVWPLGHRAIAGIFVDPVWPLGHRVSLSALFVSFSGGGLNLHRRIGNSGRNIYVGDTCRSWALHVFGPGRAATRPPNGGPRPTYNMGDNALTETCRKIY